MSGGASKYRNEMVKEVYSYIMNLWFAIMISLIFSLFLSLSSVLFFVLNFRYILMDGRYFCFVVMIFVSGI